MQEREHDSGKMMAAGASCRMVSFKTFEDELQRNCFAIIEKGICEDLPEFDRLMFAVVKKI